MAHEDFVTYEQSVKLKELGFDWECNHWYHPLEPDKIIECQTYCNYNGFERPYSAPTLSQVQKWMREGKDIHIQSKICFIKFDWYAQLIKGLSYHPKIICATTHFDTYEQALSAGIDKALELLKE